MTTHQDNRPVIGWPPPVFLRGNRRAGCIRISLDVLPDEYDHLAGFSKLLITNVQMVLEPEKTEGESAASETEPHRY